MKQYNFINDPGHAWLEVPIVELKKLGIEEKISHYSYKDGSMAFLEEDCDAPIFIEAMGLTEVNLVEVYQDPTPIRNYKRF